MTERFIFGLALTSFLISLLGVAFIVSGGLVVLPATGVAALIAGVGGLTSRRPRRGLARAGSALGFFTVIAIVGFSIYGLYFA
jgi:hypothetical protein